MDAPGKQIPMQDIQIIFAFLALFIPLFLLAISRQHRVDEEKWRRDESENRESEKKNGKNEPQNVKKMT